MAEDLYLGTTGNIIYESDGNPVAMVANIDQARELVQAVNIHRRRIEDMATSIRGGLVSIPCPHCESAGMIPTLLNEEYYPSGDAVMQDIRLAHIALCHLEHYASAAQKRYDDIHHEVERRRAREREKALQRACAYSGHGMIEMGPSRHVEWECSSDGTRCQNCDQMIDFEQMAALKIPGWRYNPETKSFGFNLEQLSEDTGYPIGAAP